MTMHENEAMSEIMDGVCDDVTSVHLGSKTTWPRFCVTSVWKSEWKVYAARSPFAWFNTLEKALEEQAHMYSGTDPSSRAFDVAVLDLDPDANADADAYAYSDSDSDLDAYANADLDANEKVKAAMRVDIQEVGAYVAPLNKHMDALRFLQHTFPRVGL